MYKVNRKTQLGRYLVRILERIRSYHQCRQHEAVIREFRHNQCQPLCPSISIYNHPHRQLSFCPLSRVTFFELIAISHELIQSFPFSMNSTFMNLCTRVFFAPHSLFRMQLLLQYMPYIIVVCKMKTKSRASIVICTTIYVCYAVMMLMLLFYVKAFCIAIGNGRGHYDAVMCGCVAQQTISYP